MSTPHPANTTPPTATPPTATPPANTPPHPTNTPTGATIHANAWAWRHAGRKNWTLNNITFTINPGERVLLLGPSGSGKSTLMAGIAGLLDHDNDGDTRGQLLINNKPAHTQRGHIGLVMQDPEAQVVLQRVGDDVAFGCENLGINPNEIWERVDNALETVGADYHPLHNTSHLSGGQKQRLALAAVTAMQPQLILLDEPTANLDPDGITRIRNATEATLNATGATAIIIEHRIDIWADIIDRVIVIHDGHIIADGTPHHILHKQHTQLHHTGIWLPHAHTPTKNHDTHHTPHHTTPPILTTNDLAIGYQPGHEIRTHINLEIPRGQSTCITGTNGSGKSTLALTLAGLLPPLNGQIHTAEDLHPRPQHGDPNTWRANELPSRISLVFQEPEYQFLTGTVRAELELGPRLNGTTGNTLNTLVDEYLDALGLTTLAHAHPMTLSGGEKRRLSVATALINAPEILILDEPTFGQDHATWTQLVALLQRALESGTTLICITHDHAFIDAFGDNIIDLNTIGNTGQGKHATLRAEHPSAATTAREANAQRHIGGAALGHINAVTRVLALILMTTPIVLTVDIISATVALLIVVGLTPLSGLSARAFLIRISPLFIAAPVSAASMLLYGKPGGTIWWEYGPATISDNSITLAASIALRIFAMAIPALLIFPSIDPTDMADGLTQILRLPERPVIASLAGARMVGLMLDDWAALGRARRVRGRGGRFRCSGFFSAAFALLVFALRRSAKLSLTMEARGFGGEAQRTHARVSALGRVDYVVLVVCALIPVVYLSAAWWAGTFVLFGLSR